MTCSGELLVNGKNYREVDYKSFIAYVMQDDVLMETMTVREAFAFASQLQMGVDEWKHHAERFPELLELEGVLDTIIGSAT